MEGLAKEVEDPVQNAELVRMKKRISALQILYFALFAASLVFIVYNPRSSLLWAVLLGAAVITRLVRTSLVNKYNAILMGGKQGPLT